MSGGRRYAYSGTPLFSYLYFAAELPDARGVAVAASLMGSDLPAPFASGLGDFASRFADETGERIRIESSARAAGPGLLDLGWPDETLLSIAIVEPDPAVRRSEVRARSVGVVVILAALAWLLHAFDGARGGVGAGGGVGARGGVRYAVGGLVVAAALVPMESVVRSPELLALATRSLDGALPMSLGRVLLLGAAAAPIAILAAPRWRPGWGAWMLPATVAIAFPSTLWWIGRAAPLEVLGSSDLEWIVLQLAATLVLALVAAAALLFRRRAGSGGGPGLAVAGLAVAAGLGVAVAAAVRTAPHVAPALAALWALPAVLVGRGVEARGRVSYPRWFCAFWLAATAVLPFAWSMRTEARMAIAEQRLAQLGIVPEPELQGLLDRFASQVDSLHRAGAGAVEMMYRSWVASGLSAQGSPIHLTLWSPDGDPEQELQIGVKGDLPAVVAERLPDVRAAGATEHHLLEDVDARHLVAVSLADGRVVTGTIPPRRTIAEPSELGPLFAAVEEGGDQEFLTLLRSPGENPGLDPGANPGPGANPDPDADPGPAAAPDPGADPGPRTGAVEWSRNAEGWMGQSTAAYPDGDYSVSYTISIPNLSVMFARATLVLVLNLVVVSLLWLLSVWILGFRFSVPIDWRKLFTSFRARVTWTLFGFFILSNVVFGTLAYRTLSGASERTATALAERVVGQIAEAYREEGGSMELLARRVGADLLEYRRGELVGGLGRRADRAWSVRELGGPRDLRGARNGAAARGLEGRQPGRLAVRARASPPSRRRHRGVSGSPPGGGGGAQAARCGGPARSRDRAGADSVAGTCADRGEGAGQADPDAAGRVGARGAGESGGPPAGGPARRVSARCSRRSTGWCCALARPARSCCAPRAEPRRSSRRSRRG